MEIIKGYKIRLLPTTEQEILFKKSVGASRFIYNWCLDKELKADKFISIGELRKEITQLKKDKDFYWLNEIGTNVIKQSAKDLGTAFGRYFKKSKQLDYQRYSKRQKEHSKRINKKLTLYDSQGYPKFKKKKDSNSFYVNYESMSKTQNGVRCEKLGNIKTSEPLPKLQLNEKHYMNPHIIYDGKYWYITFSCKEYIDESLKNNTKEIIGIDLGIKDLAVCSNGMIFKNINKSKEIKRLDKKLKRNQRQISRKYEKNKQGSKFIKTSNIIKLEQNIRLLNRRLKNIRENYIYQTINSIVKTKPAKIIVEDLNITNMMKNKHLSKSIQNQGFYKFINVLEFKTNCNFIDLQKVNKWFPSSKTCSNCGYIKKDLKLKDRVYVCSSCGLVIDRDFNASLNLANYKSV